MKRSFLLVLVACGSPAPATNVVSVSPVQASAAPQHVSVSALPQRSEFEILLSHHTCILSRGKLRCRQTMTLDKAFSSEPVVTGLEQVDVMSAAFGRDFGCVVARGGDVQCWGGNHFGQLGANVRAETHEGPIALPGVHHAKRIFGGPYTMCAILDDGRISCWGKNQFGENGSSTNYLEAARELVEPQLVPGVDDVVDLALGWDATCALSSKGKVSCWGRSKLPEQKSSGPSNEAPTVIASLEHAKQITANEETLCAVKDEKLLCWGSMYMLVKNAPRDQLVTVGIDHVSRVSLGANHGCALDMAGAVWCFGTNMEGNIGVPPVKGVYGASDPVKVEGVPRATDVMCSTAYSCALTTTNELWCWGRFTWDKEEIHPPTRISI